MAQTDKGMYRFIDRWIQAVQNLQSDSEIQGMASIYKQNIFADWIIDKIRCKDILLSICRVIGKDLYQYKWQHFATKILKSIQLVRQQSELYLQLKQKIQSLIPHKQNNYDRVESKLEELMINFQFCLNFLKNQASDHIQQQFPEYYDNNINSMIYPVKANVKLIVAKENALSLKRITEIQEIQIINKQFPQLRIDYNSGFKEKFDKIKIYFGSKFLKLNKQMIYIKASLNNMSNGSQYTLDSYFAEIQDEDIRNRLKMFKQAIFKSYSSKQIKLNNISQENNHKTLQQIQNIRRQLLTVLLELKIKCQNSLSIKEIIKILKERFHQIIQRQANIAQTLQNYSKTDKFIRQLSQTFQIQIDLAKDSADNYINKIKEKTVTPQVRDRLVFVENLKVQFQALIIKSKEQFQKQLFQSRVMQIVKTHPSLVEQMRNLKQEVNIHTHNRTILENQLRAGNQMRNHFNQLQMKLQNFSQENKRLSFEFYQNRSMLQLQMKKNQKLEEHLKQRLEQYQRQKNEIISKFSIEIENQRKNNTNFSNDTLIIQSELLQQKKINKQKINQNMNLSNIIQTLKRDIQNVKLSQNQLRNQISNIQQQSITKTTQLLKNNHSLQEQNRRLLVQTSTLKGFIQSLSMRVQQLQNSERQLASTIQSNYARCNDYNQQIQTRIQKQNEEKQKYNILLNQHTLLIKESQRLKQQRLSLQEYLNIQFNNNMKEQSQKIRQSVQQLKEQNFKLNTENQNSRKYIEQLKFKVKQLSNNKQNAQQKSSLQIKKLSQRIIEIQTQKIATKNQHTKKLKQLEKNYASQIHQLKKEKNDLQFKYCEMERDLTMQRTKLFQLQEQQSNMTSNIEWYQRQNKWNNDIQEIQKENKKLKDQIENQINKKQQNELLLSKEQNILELTRNKQVLEKQKEQWRVRQQSLLSQIKELIIKESQYELSIKQMKDKIKSQSTVPSISVTTPVQQGLENGSIPKFLIKNKSSNQLNNPLEVPLTDMTLFSNQIFEDRQAQKRILINHIQTYMGSKIAKSKLLYKFDPLNQTNVHKYIDDIQSLLCIIKTKCATIAGYYPGALTEKETTLDKGGLIVSVDNNQSYRLQERKNATDRVYRGMVYDKYFIIFGNSEIRVKSGDRVLFSNFGVNNSYFNSRQHNISNFLNEGSKREMQFDYCEYYQVIFSTQSMINP